MTDWGRRVMVAVAGVVATTLGGCESPMAPPATSGDVLAGQWTACLNEGAGDFRKSIAFYPDASFLLVTEPHATTDRTCGGAVAGTTYAAWSYRLGKSVPASIGPAGTSVTAREINLMNARVTIYSIVYQDAAATPNLLYLGDLQLDPAFDGTAATKRPDALSASALSSL